MRSSLPARMMLALLTACGAAHAPATTPRSSDSSAAHREHAESGVKRFPVAGKIALVPLENLSHAPDANAIVLRLVEDSFSRESIAVTGVLTAIPRDRLPTPMEIQQAAAAAGARYALSGSVVEFGYRPGTLPGDPAEPIVSVNVRLLDIQTGGIVWEAIFGGNSGRKMKIRRDLGMVATGIADDMAAALAVTAGPGGAP